MDLPLECTKSSIISFSEVLYVLLKMTWPQTAMSIEVKVVTLNQIRILVSSYAILE